jgi:predicted DNA-binding transcriptional regulator AlpA
LEARVEEALGYLEAGAKDRARAVLQELIEDESVAEAEAALMLGVARRTMQNWRQDGTGPRYFKIGPGDRGGVRYSRLEIREYRERRSSMSTAELRGSSS